VGYAYAVEYFLAWYSHNIVEQESFHWRALGTYSLQFWIMVICNSLVPLLFFMKRIRRSIPWLFAISILINIGMWFERFVIIIGSVAHDFMPNAWGVYSPSVIEYGILLGSFSLFFFLFLLFVKHLPSVSMTEMKEASSKGEVHEA
jgi:Ni/Fe-hydrogenase subunit HybB-like protein